MAWYLNRALTGFRAAVNAAYPNRDKASDGTIGDRVHQATRSDHNPDPDESVDAFDMDVDLRSGNDAEAIEKLKRVFEQHPSSSYWIHNDQIALRSEGWRRKSYAYAGPGRNKHDRHVHWNTRESHENSTVPWILEDDMPLTEADVKRVASAVHGQKLGKSQTTIGAAIQTTNSNAAKLVLGQAAILTAIQGVSEEAVLAAVNARADELAAAIAEVPQDTVEALGDLESPEEIASRLRAVLGDKAAAVGALLAQG
jgi:hypothetical protein